MAGSMVEGVAFTVEDDEPSAGSLVMIDVSSVSLAFLEGEDSDAAVDTFLVDSTRLRLTAGFEDGKIELILEGRSTHNCK